MMDLTKPPANDADAKARAEKFERDDPFKDMPRALLSSVEILDYANVTGMLFPFREEQLKSASYEVYIGGEVIWWDGKGQRHSKVVRRGSPLVLEANSIVFVQVEPTFRLPNYIAIRFNLRITHVHRGLLLGTGPLVDPGFHGQLLIPLHNLTSENYEINTNDALIWIEFTKTTFGYEPPADDTLALKSRDTLFKGFPPDKRYMTPDEYLHKANGDRPIQSSIPDIFLQSQGAAERAQEESQSAQIEAEAAKEAAERADTSVTKTKSYIAIGALAAVITVAISLYQIGQQFGAMLQSFQSITVSLVADSKTLTEKVTTIAADNKTLLDKAAETKSRNNELSRRVDELSTQVQQQKTAPPPAVRARQVSRRRKRG